MSYELRPKASGDTLVDSRNPIRTNFDIIQKRFEYNHTEFSSGVGKHKYLQMPEQTTAPTTAVDEGGLYTKVGATSAVTELFFRRENNGTEIQLTGVGGSIPTILSGSKALTTVYANLVLVPANSFGTIYIRNQNFPQTLQSGMFFCDATKAYAASNVPRDTAENTNENFIVFLNLATDLNIQAKTFSAFYNNTYDYKIVYWTP